METKIIGGAAVAWEPGAVLGPEIVCTEAAAPKPYYERAGITCWSSPRC